MKQSIDENAAYKRLDTYLAELYPSLSRSRIQSLIRKGDIRVNDMMVKTGYSLRAGDTIDINIPPPREETVSGVDISIDIVYEDSDIIVINKPKGMVVHPAPGHRDDTLVNALIYHCGDSLSGIGGVTRPGIVHRIDKDTTGLIIACKNDFSHRIISRELKDHKMERVYTALCYGGFKEDEGLIDAPVGRLRSDRKLMTARDPVNPRAALTHYLVSERLRFKGETISLLKVYLETGRTHQIRVHMSYLGHPLLGDPLYGRKHDPFSGQGQYLHAATLSFNHPRTGEEMSFSAPLPAYFTKTLDKLRNSQYGA